MEMRHLQHGLGIAVMAVLTACGASPEDVADIRSNQKQILDKLGEAEKKLALVAAAGQRPAAPTPAQDPNKVYNLPVGTSPVRGPAAAKVSIVAFEDFQCPFCGQAAQMIDTVLKEYPEGVNLVFKQMPLTQIHPFALNAAKASIAAQRQGKFWEMHDALFKNMRMLQPEKVRGYAEEIGLDMARFDKDMASADLDTQIKEDVTLAQTAGVRGTPTIFVGGKLLQNRSLDGFKALIDPVLKN
jgi:protein-disulfide isomerase